MTGETAVRITAETSGGCGSSACVMPQAGGELVLLGEPVVPLVCLGLVVAAVAHLRSAVTTLDEERSRLAAEREAFLEFAGRLAELDLGAEQPIGSRTETRTRKQPVTVVADTDDHGYRRVERAYRETVMAVPHYEEDYDEPLSTHMRTELEGPETQAMLERETANPVIRDTLVGRARAAALSRDDLLSTLETERESLLAAIDLRSELTDSLDSLREIPPLDRSFGGLLAVWHRLDDIEERCDDHIEQRQEQIQATTIDQPRTAESSVGTLPEYLYESLDVTYPVLHDYLGIRQEVQSERSKLVASMSVSG